MIASFFAAHVLLNQDFNAPQAWDTVSKRISTMYWAKKADPDRVERLLKEAESSAKGAKSIAEFNDAMDAMIAKFGDSHFDFLTREDQGYYLFDGLTKGEKGAKMPDVGGWFRKTKDGYTVQMVLNGGALEKAGIRKGDRMETVDGRPFSPIGGLAPAVGRDAKLTYRRSGAELTANVPVSESVAIDFFLKPTLASQRVIDRDGKKIGYIHLWTMSNEKFKTALESFVYNQAKDTDAFVLDIRDGFGGRPEGYGDPFFRPEARLDWTVGTGGSIKQLFGYARPLVIIINEGSRSAKEVFSYLMKKSGRATLVGSHTAGDVLGTSPSAVGDWAYIEIPMVDVKIDGVRLEKNPVQADVQVSPEFDAQGNDLFLEKALDVAAERARAAADRAITALRSPARSPRPGLAAF